MVEPTNTITWVMIILQYVWHLCYLQSCVPLPSLLIVSTFQPIIFIYKSYDFVYHGGWTNVLSLNIPEKNGINNSLKNTQCFGKKLYFSFKICDDYSTVIRNSCYILFYRPFLLIVFFISVLCYLWMF